MGSKGSPSAGKVLLILRVTTFNVEIRKMKCNNKRFWIRHVCITFEISLCCSCAPLSHQVQTWSILPTLHSNGRQNMDPSCYSEYKNQQKCGNEGKNWVQRKHEWNGLQGSWWQPFSGTIRGLCKLLGLTPGKKRSVAKELYLKTLDHLRKVLKNKWPGLLSNRVWLFHDNASLSHTKNYGGFPRQFWLHCFQAPSI